MPSSSSPQTLFFVSLLILTLFSFPLIQARESKFFSKFTHFSTISTQQIDQPISSTPTSSPILSSTTPAPAPSPTNFQSDTNTANGDETELFDEEFENRSQSSNENNNNNYGYKLASESHETANRNGYEGGGYEPVSTSSSRETVANGERNSYNGEETEVFGDKFEKESQSSNNNNYGYKLASENHETANLNGYEAVSTSSSRETVPNSERSNYNGDGTELFDDKFEKESQNSNNNKYGYKLASESHETANPNGYEVVSTSSSHEGGYEPVSTSSSQETVANGEKNNYNGYTGNNGNGNSENEFFSSSSYEKKKEREGMSDTRFVENGKYYYDVQKENNENYYPAANNGYNYAQNNNYGNGNRNENGFNTKMGFENEEVYDESLP